MAAVAYNTLRKWVKAGRLHPQKEMRLLGNGQRREVLVFDSAELRKILRRRNLNAPGELAARAFEMFEEGRQINEVVIALRQLPEYVEALHDHWAWSDGRGLVITSVARREHERILGSVVSVADIVERVTELARKATSQGERP